MRHGDLRPSLGLKRPARGRASGTVCMRISAFRDYAHIQSGVLQIGCRLLAALGHDLIRDTLAFVERAHAGTFDRADMHKNVLRAVARSDESKTFLGVEKLNCTCGHRGLLASFAA